MGQREVHPLIVQLAQMRIANDISRNAAVRRAGLGATTVRDWEVGRCGATVHGLEQYAGLFGYRLALVPEHADPRRAEQLEALELERLPVSPVELAPVTAEQAAENRRVLAQALGINDDMPLADRGMQLVHGDAA
ncbi:hypothetical protein ACFY4C_20430 [Actinomadura viridis]|uniref:hypothetical protein n=1 Tax=Actinomadura viridis TaxID=58110 RepID=UPI0036A96B8B